MRISVLALLIASGSLGLFGPGVQGALAQRVARQLPAVFAGSLPAAYQGPVRVDLSGRWDFRFDPGGQGEDAEWYASDSKWPAFKATVPGSFNQEFAKDPGRPDPTDTYLFYKGKAWYRREFTGPRTNADLFLHLSGAVLRQKVWLNGHFVGASLLPWLDVAYNVSAEVRRGAVNTLVTEVDNSILPEAIPDAHWRGWWDDGGLIWPVYLEERPQVRAQSFVNTTMKAGGRWQIDVETSVHEDSPKHAVVLLELRDNGGKTVWRKTELLPEAGTDVKVSSTAVLEGIRSWSPEHPELYRLMVKVGTPGGQTDLTSFHIGFRQIEVKGSQLLLNGEPITLRGINRHEMAPGVGQTLSVAQNRKDLQDIKSLGANFVRLTHYSQTQDVYDECDKLGLLSWTEIPAWQSSVATLGSEEVWRDYAAPQLDQVVRQHRNHPSVIIWSVANEIPSDKPEGAAFVAKAVGYVHQLDSSRLVTFASDKREKDLAFDSVDLIAVNEYFGWYYGKIDDVGPMLDELHAKYPQKPILVSEFGSESVANWNPESAKDGSKNYSYEYQARFLASQLVQIYAPRRRSYVAGGAIWVYSDFRDPHRINGDHPDAARYRNSKGLVTMDRARKPAYKVVEDFFHDLMREHGEGSSR